MKPNAGAPRSTISDQELRALENYARIEGLDVAIDIFAGLQKELLALPERVTDDPKIQARIRNELSRITEETAARTFAKAKELENGQDH